MFSGGKFGRCVELAILPLSYDNCLEIWEPQPPGTLRVCFALPKLSSFMKNLSCWSGIVSCVRTDRRDEALVALRLIVICSFRLKSSWWQQIPTHPGRKLTFRHPCDTTAITVCFSHHISTTKHTYRLWIHEIFKDSYLVSSASNLPSCVSRRSPQVLFYEFIPLL
jgi:hypothetical protein